MSKIQKMLISDEGLKLKPYRCTVGKLTIGVGRNLDDVGITEAEAMHLLNNDIERVKSALSNVPAFNGLSENRKAAIINMSFQIGVVGCLAFKNMWSAIERKDWQAAHKEALSSRWAMQTPERAKRVANIILTDRVEGY